MSFSKQFVYSCFIVVKYAHAATSRFKYESQYTLGLAVIYVYIDVHNIHVCMHYPL
jgi:hypothetical protein